MTTYNQAMYEGRKASAGGDRATAKARFFDAVQQADIQPQLEAALACAKSAGATKSQLAHGAVQRGAELSECLEYRYALTRCWDKRLPQISWVMLNPSTAESLVDDPTVRKCIGFSKLWGYGSLRIVNLFALRSTDPRNLGLVPDPVGPENITGYLRTVERPVVAAWGGSLPKLQDADQVVGEVRQMALEARAASPIRGWWCLGRTKAGEPRHPLMLSYKTEREPWPAKVEP